MKKAELVKIIAKKAAVSESLAKELFDLFLRKIADELQPGESAQLSNVGYFHLRKGKIKIESEDTEGENIEYIDADTGQSVKTKASSKIAKEIEIYRDEVEAIKTTEQLVEIIAKIIS